MRRLALVPVALVLALVVGVGWLLLPNPDLPPVDVVELNDVARTAADQWPRPSLASGLTGDYSIATPDGRVLASSGQAVTDPMDAGRQRAFTMPIVVDGAVVGYVFAADPAREVWRDTQRGLVARAVAVLLVVTAAALLAWAYLYLRVVRPFAQLNEFATRVADGDLAAPLQMDRANSFGAFTEAFDLMREQLAEARRGEAEARESKQRLVTQIGHDIRTPVASISAATELLATQVGEPAALARIGTVSAKAHQIDRLLADLIRANRTEPIALVVTPGEITSSAVAELIRHADFDERADIAPPPECLVNTDPERLQQVFDNVVMNSYKYAGTPITVTWSLTDGFLVAHLADAGSGVGPDELDTIFAPGVRGAGVGDVPGSGIGLYTSAYLMERMDGAISARNVDGGFVVDVEIALAS